MAAENRKVDPFQDINGLVSLFLEDIADRPVPPGAESLLEEIRVATAHGDATVSMAAAIVELFPYDRPE
jgi:hypothetical protein